MINCSTSFYNEPFKKGRFPSPRGARNVRQLISIHRGKHSEKPERIIDGITKMFPTQEKIELFARKNYVGWDNWGLEIPDEKIEILSQGEIDEKQHEETLTSAEKKNSQIHPDKDVQLSLHMI